MNNQTKISAVLPCYNVAKYLPRCLDSLLRQNFEEWEAILIDDGSSDETLAIAEEYAQRDARFKVFHFDNQGVSAARNEGFKRVQGEVTQFIDPDDFIEDKCFSTVWRVYESHRPDMIHFNKWRYHYDHPGEKLTDDELVNETFVGGGILKQYTQALVGIGTEALQHWYKGENLWYYKKPWAVWQFAFKTEMLRKNKLQFQPHVKNNEDAMFVVECSIYAQSVVCISDYLYNYDFRKDGALFSRVNSKDKIFYDKYVLIAERERLRKLVKQVDLVDNYCGSQVFSCIQLCVSLSSSGYAGYRQCKKYICDKHVQDSIRRVPIKGAPLKFRIPVLLLKCHMQWLLFALIYLLSKFGMADKLKA